MNEFKYKYKNKKGMRFIKRRQYNFDKDEFIENYNLLKSSKKMGDLYNCDKSVILRYAKKIGYTNKFTGILSDKQKQEIINQYETKTSTELAEKYGVNRGIITKIWHDNNLIGKDKHTYPFDYNYFENINSPDKAYFLGFLAADGNVFKRNNKTNSQSIIKLSLQKTDKNILEIFKLYIDSQKPLSESKRESSYVNYISILELVSDKMANDLKKYNIVENKTYSYEIVELKQELMSHFFRGYFDGDGSISCTNNKYHTPSSYNISIVGFVHNLSKMQNYLNNNTEIKSSIVLDKRNAQNNKSDLPFGNLIFPNIENKYKFINYIYQDRQDLYLPRKRYLAECFLNAINKNYSNKQNLYNNILMPS